MARIESKQIRRVLAANIKIIGLAVTASSSSTTVTSQITTTLVSAGDGGTAVPLVVSTDYKTPGVIVNPPYNRIEVYDNVTKKKIGTLSGEEVYGRLTQSSGVYTLSYFYLASSTGVETPYIFTANQNIDFEFNYRFDLYQLPSESIIGLSARNVYQDPNSTGTGTVIIEQLSVFSLNTLAPLSNIPNNTNKVLLYVNGQTIDSLGGSSAAFTISGGVNITWNSTNAGYSLEITDRVIAEYYV